MAGCAFAPLLPRAVRAADPAYDFVFTRLMYESGDWDVDQRMPS
ncbi:MAG: twin-arginine translocation pathway signal, partial [Dokdonella sp.]